MAKFAVGDRVRLTSECLQAFGRKGTVVQRGGRIGGHDYHYTVMPDSRAGTICANAWELEKIEEPSHA